MTELKQLPLNWAPADVANWRIALTPVDSLGLPIAKFGALVGVPAREDLEVFANRLSALVRDTVILEMNRVYAEQGKEAVLALD